MPGPLAALALRLGAIGGGALVGALGHRLGRSVRITKAGKRAKLGALRLTPVGAVARLTGADRYRVSFDARPPRIPGPQVGGGGRRRRR